MASKNRPPINPEDFGMDRASNLPSHGRKQKPEIVVPDLNVPEEFQGDAPLLLAGVDEYAIENANKFILPVLRKYPKLATGFTREFWEQLYKTRRIGSSLPAQKVVEEILSLRREFPKLLNLPDLSITEDSGEISFLQMSPELEESPKRSVGGQPADERAMATFRERIAEAIARHPAKTQAELAKLAQVDKSKVSKWVSKGLSRNSAAVAKLAVVLGISPESLWSDQLDIKSEPLVPLPPDASTKEQSIAMSPTDKFHRLLSDSQYHNPMLLIVNSLYDSAFPEPE